MVNVVPLIQNFSIPRGDSAAVNYTVQADSSITLLGSDISWILYSQNNGIVDYEDVLLEKVLDDGIQIDDPDELKFHVSLIPADTQDFRGNYYYRSKVTIEDATVTVAHGIMTVT